MGLPGHSLHSEKWNEYSSEEFALPCIIQELYSVVRKVFSTKAIHIIWRVINILISEGDEFLSCLK